MGQEDTRGGRAREFQRSAREGIRVKEEGVRAREEGVSDTSLHPAQQPSSSLTTHHQGGLIGYTPQGEVGTASVEVGHETRKKLTVFKADTKVFKTNAMQGGKGQTTVSYISEPLADDVFGGLTPKPNHTHMHTSLSPPLPLLT